MRCLRGFCATSDPRRFDAEPLAVRSRSVIDVNRAARLFLTSLPWGHRMYETVQQNASADSVIDLRSDTVTKPSLEMRRAMFEAEVGDDVYAEDPTINRLESRAAEIFERDAALFVPSGSMGNLLAIWCWTDRGQEVICDARSHTYIHEMGAMSAIAGVMPRT